MKFKTLVAAAMAVMMGSGVALAQQGETVKLAMIEGLSGPMGNVGTNQLKTLQYLAGQLNAEENPAGVKFEVIAMDSKSSPQEAINLLRSAIDQGVQYVIQGNGSNVGIPLSEAVAKHNSRNPGSEVVYFNYAAVDPDLTNDKCSYWHFRFDADTSIKMKALSNFMKDQPVSKYYLNNQNYSHGHQVAEYFKKYFSQAKPDAEAVGEDYVALGQVKDFAPYVAKIKDSGADTVVTGSWGQDYTLLVKAMNDAGLDLPIYSYYAVVSGTPTALAQGDHANVYQVAAFGHSNMKGRIGELMQGFKEKYDDDLYTTPIYSILVGVSHAMAKAGSTDPVKVAAALEGLEFEGIDGPVVMRADDHQLQQPVWISRWQKVDDEYTYSVEDTGYTFAPVKRIDAETASTPTTCKMQRSG